MDANQKQNNSEIKWLYKVLVWGSVFTNTNSKDHYADDLIKRIKLQHCKTSTTYSLYFYDVTKMYNFPTSP